MCVLQVMADIEIPLSTRLDLLELSRRGLIAAADTTVHFRAIFTYLRGKHLTRGEMTTQLTTMANSSLAFANKLESETASFDLKNMSPYESTTYASPSVNSTEHNFSYSVRKKLFLCAVGVVAVSVLINCLLLLLILISNSPHEIHTQNTSSSQYQQCPVGWKAYSDIKCIKVFDQMTTHHEAFELCQAADPTANLLNIQTEAEQAFMEDLLFSEDGGDSGTPQLFNHVWLFGRWHNISGRIDFDDGNVLKHVTDPFQGYSNWAEGSKHRFLSGRECTQMLAEPHHDHLQHNSDENNDNKNTSTSISSNSIGKWVSVRCQQKSAVVCQRLQNWSPEMTQKSLLKWSIKMEHQQKEIDALKEANQVPLGFVYVQLPKEPAPAELWPLLTWQEISAAYAGVFFRVAGEGAAPFGQLQGESSPHLSEIRVKSSRLEEEEGEHEVNISTVSHLVPGQWADGIDLRRIMLVPEDRGSTSAHLTRYTPLQSVQFKVASEEVRPRNMAVKVWKRIQ